ncbi:MAG: NAD-dependent epimerase/dehydratase family protein [Gemmatimonadaceae bacterium]
MDLAGARAIVLGASGFIGRWVARRLTLEGTALWCTARDPVGAARIFEQYEVTSTLCRLDVLATDDLAHLLREVRPHTVFNLAGYGVDQRERDPDLARAINQETVQTLVDLVPRLCDPAWRGLSLVHTGSALEYGEAGGGGDLSEETAPNPTTVYGRTKLTGTEILADAERRGAIKAVAARLFTVYGPGEHAGRLLPTLLKAAGSTGRVALSSGTQRRDFTYVEDVALGLSRLAAANRPMPAIMNLATGKLTAVREFVALAASALGIANERLGFGDVPQRPEEMQHSAVSVDRLRSALGWVPATPIPAGVQATARFVAERGVT